MALLCERCKREIFRYEICNYCGRKICDSCVKSSQKPQKTVRLVICKDCWSDMKKRKAFKSRRGSMEMEAPAERSERPQ